MASVVRTDYPKIALTDDDRPRRERDGCTMNSTATDFAYIASDVPDSVTLREYGKALAAERSTGESRLRRAVHGLHIGHGSLRRPRPSLRLA